MATNEPKTWNSVQDVELDFWAYSEHAEPDSIQPAPPKSVAEFYLRRGEKEFNSIFDTSIPEDVEYVYSGRGKRQVNRIVKPGEGVPNNENDCEDLYMKIRECSGIGYRNEVIEQHFKTASLADSSDEEFESFLKLTTPKTSPYSSGKSTPKTSSSGGPTPKKSQKVRSENGTESATSFESDSAYCAKRKTHTPPGFKENWKPTDSESRNVNIASKNDFPPLST